MRFHGLRNRTVQLAICSSSTRGRSSCSASICPCMGCDLPVEASTSRSSLHFNRSSPNNARLLASVSQLARACRMRRPLDPSRSLTTIDSLMLICFQQTLDLTLYAHPVACELKFHLGQVAPDALFSIRYKTQNQLLCDQPPHQPLCVLEVVLAPSRSTVGECLCQVQTPYAAPTPATPIASTAPSIPSPLLQRSALAATSISGATHLAWWRTAPLRLRLRRARIHDSTIRTSYVRLFLQPCRPS
jgi:hypothetical protein